jgi:RHS repeat-associated protein
VGETSAAAMIAETNPGTSKTGTLVLNKTATKNGYVYIYLSNESTNTPVYFDDMQLSHKHGPIVEDNAYYPFGLKIQGISARAALKPKTKEGYQGEFNEFDEESGYNEFELRSYDAQIGRWIQVDPKDQLESPYTGMINNPISNIDRDGGWSLGFTGAVVGALAGGTAAYFILKNNPNMNQGFKTVVGIGLPLIGAGIGYAAFESMSNNPKIFGRPDRIGGSPSRWKEDGIKGTFGENASSNFIANFKQFYVGLIGATKQTDYLIEDANRSTSALTPDIKVLGWRDNNLPDWDYWRILRQREDPNFYLSWGGLFWRALSTAKPYLGYANLTPKAHLSRLPGLSWYLYWLIHKPKKGTSPLNHGTRRESINNYFDRNPNADSDFNELSFSALLQIYL